MKNLMNRTIQLIRGKTAPRAHAELPDGSYEEEWGRLGFSGTVSHLYHKHPPTGWTDIDGPLKPHSLSPLAMNRLDGERVVFLENSDVAIGVQLVIADWNYYFRNGEADELLFVHQGSGNLETHVGTLHYERGDYLHLPRGTTYRFCPEELTELLTIEAFTAPFDIPERGIVGQHVPFDPSLIEYPTPDQTSVWNGDKSGKFQVKIKRLGAITTFTYPHNPCDVIGYKGDLAPWRINVRDFAPLLSHRQHLPPPAHITLISGGFVVCTFLPRPLESEPGALKVPFYHSNVDYDEVLFYHDGDFFSRSGIDAGMVTFHPAGFPHGPHPKAIQRTDKKTFTDEVAVMIDTRRPLELTQAGKAVENSDYWKSWME